MGEEPAGAGVTPEELTYYRAIEDRFGHLRGTPFLFRPTDFALMRRWWVERVPLAAVLAGLQEVFERRRESSAGPVSSLAYCRHAIARHAKRLISTGSAAVEPATFDPGEALARLASQVRAAAARWVEAAAVTANLETLALAIDGLPTDAEPAALEEALNRLEVGALESVAASLPTAAATAVEASVSAAMRTVKGETDTATRTRMERAVRLRALRDVLGVPRLELVADAPGH